jgi:glycosyltransferase involved in cell wall biosynthesis
MEKEKLLGLVPSAQVAVVPHPVYDMFASDWISPEKARRQLNLPLDRPILLFFGIVREYKGLNDILTAMPEIRAQLGELLLVVAGEFWENRHTCQEIIDRLKLGDSVIIDDRYIPNEEVGLYFAAADVLVAPYRRVTGSGVVQMARGFGLPVITTAEDIKETSYDGGLGWLVPPEDSRALSEAVVQFFAKKRSGLIKRDPPPAGSASNWQGLISQVEQCLGVKAQSPSCGKV